MTGSRLSMRLAFVGWLLGLACAAPVQAQEPDTPRAVLERSAEAMGGLGRLQGLDNVVLTGFGQRAYYQGGGNITGE